MVVAAVDFPALSRVSPDKPVHMSVDTALARLFFPPHRWTPAEPTQVRALSGQSTVGPSPRSPVRAVRGAAFSI